MQQIAVNEYGCYQAPPFVLVTDQIICLGAIGVQDPFGKATPKGDRAHGARLPHQHEDEEIGDQEHDRENVWPRKNDAGVRQVVAFVQRNLPGCRLRQRRPANVAGGFARADQGTTISADTRTPGN